MNAAGITKGIMSHYGVEDAKTKDKDSLNKDAFLNLLVTQMQHQDPLEPTKNEDFLAQMAQFSALEQMKNLNTGFRMQQGNELLGKVIIGKVEDNERGGMQYISGAVEATKLKNGEVFLLVDNKEVELAKVEGVLKDNSSENFTANSLDEIRRSLDSINQKLEDLMAAQEEAEEETVEDGEEAVEETGVSDDE